MARKTRRKRHGKRKTNRRKRPIRVELISSQMILARIRKAMPPVSYFHKPRKRQRIAR